MRNNKLFNLILSFIGLGLFLAIVLIVYGSVQQSQKADLHYTYPDTTAYKTGELLVPDYVCSDTLLIMDGPGLTSAMENLIQTGGGADGDIDSVIHSLNPNGLHYCMTFDEYLEFLDGEGYRQDIAEHLAFVHFKILKPDSLYYSILED